MMMWQITLLILIFFWSTGFLTEFWYAIRTEHKRLSNTKIDTIEQDIQEVLKLIEYDYYGLYGKHLGEQPPVEAPINACEIYTTASLKQSYVTLCNSCGAVAHPPFIYKVCVCKRCGHNIAMRMREMETDYLDNWKFNKPDSLRH